MGPSIPYEDWGKGMGVGTWIREKGEDSEGQDSYLLAPFCV